MKREGCFCVLLLFVSSVIATRVIETEYLVVGAGPAGCVASVEIAEDHSRPDVLLVEVGPSLEEMINREVVDNADRYLEAPDAEDIDYDYATTNQPNAFGRSIRLSRAKVLGGCDSHNGMVYRLGDLDLLEDWNLPGWRRGTVRRHIEQTRERSRPIQTPQAPSAVQEETIQDIMAAGITRVSDADNFGETKLGVGRIPHHVKIVNGTYWLRYSAYRSYVLDSSRYDRNWKINDTSAGHPNKNLKVGSLTRVDKLLITDDKKVVGALATDLRNGEELVLWANKKVILAGGAYATPSLLQASGIGPAEELEAKGIKVVVDSPQVGKNLHDHWAMVQIKTVRAGSFVRAVGSKFTTAVSTVSGLGTLKPTAAYDMWQTEQPNFAYIGWPTEVFFNVMYNLNTFGNGTVSYNPADPSKPIIDPGLFQNPAELDFLLQLFKEGRRLTANMDIYPVELVPGAVYVNGTYVRELTDEELKGFIVSSMSHGSHPTGTVRMGVDDNDPLDTRMRVRGVRNLLVADVSAAPNPIGAGTKPLALLFGSRAAQFALN